MNPLALSSLAGLAAREAIAAQPPPRPGQGDVWAEVIPALPPELRADAEARRQLGIERYGTPLQRGNGRDMAADGYQEALDGIAYAYGVGGDDLEIEEIRRVSVRLATLWRRRIGGRRHE